MKNPDNIWLSLKTLLKGIVSRFIEARRNGRRQGFLLCCEEKKQALLASGASPSPRGDNVADVEVDAKPIDDGKKGDNSVDVQAAHICQPTDGDSSGDVKVTTINSQQTGGDKSGNLPVTPQTDMTEGGNSGGVTVTPTTQHSSILDLPVPTVDYELNVFLDEIAEDITEEELARMKRMIKNQQGTGRALLEAMKTPIDLFDHLQNRGMLDKNNMLHVQSLVWHIGRKDLHRKLVDFARDFSQKPLYFFAPRDTPVNGYKHLHFHVAGDLEKITREEVEHLRSLISRLQRVPVEFVLLAGIEPFNSLVITFMVPEEAIDTMLQLSDVEKSLLQNMRIDFFRLGEEKVLISGKTFDKPATLTEESEVKKILNKNGKLEEELDQSQANLLQKGKALKTSQKQFSASQKQISDLKKQISVLENKYETAKQKRNEAMMMLSASVYNQSQRRPVSPVETLQLSSALSYFRFCFKSFRKEYPYCSEVIEQLLEANSLVARLEEQTIWRTYTETLANNYSFLEQKYEKFYYFHSGLKESRIQDSLMSRLKRSAGQRSRMVNSQYSQNLSSTTAERIPQQENVKRRLFKRRQNLEPKPDDAEAYLPSYSFQRTRHSCFEQNIKDVDQCTKRPIAGQCIHKQGGKGGI